MKRILTATIISALITLPSFAADTQKPVKYEIGNYNFSFDISEEKSEQEQEQKEVKNVPTQETSTSKQLSPLDSVNFSGIQKEEKVNAEKIKPVAESINTQKQVVRQIKQEEQAKKDLKEITKEEKPSEIQEQNTKEGKEQTDCKTESSKEIDNEEVKTPIPQSSVTPNFKELKTKIPVKTHTPMPTQKVLDELQSTVVNNATPAKRVVQPTKPPAKEPQHSKVVKEEQIEEITLTEIKKIDNGENGSSTAVSNTETQTEKSKNTDKKPKEKKKLPFSFELQKMQYNGVDSRQL